MSTPEEIAEEIAAKHGVQDKQPPSPAGRPWPVLGAEAMYGLPGEIVGVVAPHTEADPAAMLFTLLASAGCMAGRGPHMFVGGTEHGARLWPLVIGSTAGGMKGTSWAEMKQVIREADEKFTKDRVVGGLSSAEGLIVKVRDPSGDPEDDDYDAGVLDKRLLVVESEFATVLAQGKREGNTLLPRLREAWDGSVLQTLTIRPRVASDTHITVIGHITPTELRSKLSEAERAGGTMNRFLPVMSRRSKRLPDGGDLSFSEIKRLGALLAERVEKASTVKRIRRGVEAGEYWREMYTRLTPDHVGDGPVAQVVARAAPQVVRMSVTVAVLDGADHITVDHLKAAEAMWSYVEDSAWYVFGNTSGNPDLDRLKLFVDASGEEGVSRTDISKDCFGRHRTKAQLTNLTNELLGLGSYEMYDKPTGGAPAKMLRRKKE